MLFGVGDLPEELVLRLVLFLAAPDVLNLLCCNQSFQQLGKSNRFWSDLCKRDCDIDDANSINNSAVESSMAEIKQKFLIDSHAANVANDGIQWHQAGSHRLGPSAREGHLMCVMEGNRTSVSKRVILHGGFCDDDLVHVLKVVASSNRIPRDGSEPSASAPRLQERWESFEPTRHASNVYGASLTAIDGNQAVRFGGFRGGGYTAETNEVCVLHFGDASNNSSNDRVFWWESKLSHVGTRGTQEGPLVAEARAYHSATLILNRYIVYLGGMMSHGSKLSPAILDTKTWSWLDVHVNDPNASPVPSGRHGHSVVLDSCRNRLVLFGGGSGSDLLRSGVDNTEVWELNMGPNWSSDFEGSFPWTWKQLYLDANDDADDDDDELGGVSGGARPSPLSPSQALCLGRCHAGHKISRDVVLLAFGSGTPVSTNGVLSYNLRSDSFASLKQASSSRIPMGRFTAASAYVDGWFIVHGGYDSRTGDTIGDTCVLDVAPGLRRRFQPLLLEPHAYSHPPITDEDVTRRIRGRVGGRPSGLLGELLANLTRMESNRRSRLERLLGGAVQRDAMLLSMMANGHIQIVDGADVGHRSSDFEEDDEDVDDSDYHDDS